jgi:hypothetical protein
MPDRDFLSPLGAVVTAAWSATTTLRSIAIELELLEQLSVLSHTRWLSKIRRIPREASACSPAEATPKYFI